MKEKKDWRKALERSERRWGISKAIIMAFLFQESSFRAKVRPEREYLLGVVPWKRPSSAYGYAQATDEAWADYTNRVFNIFPSRSTFKDSVDFVGWYNNRSHKVLRIRKDDAYRLYLAYHEGMQGYRSKAWKRKKS